MLGFSITSTSHILHNNISLPAGDFANYSRFLTMRYGLCTAYGLDRSSLEHHPHCVLSQHLIPYTPLGL